VLVLHYVKGLAREQVARRLQISLQAVKGRLARGRDLLRSRLLKKGISLAAVAAVFSHQAQASVDDRQQQLLDATIHHWMEGTPVSIARIQLSDLTRKDFGMFTSNGIASKLTATGLLIVALCIAFVVGRLTPAGGSTGAAPVLDAQLQGAPLATAQPAAMDNLVESGFDNGSEAPILLVSAQETRPAAVPDTDTPNVVAVQQDWNELTVANGPTQPAALAPVTQISANTVTIQDAPRVGLPEGKWVRNSPMGKVTSEVNGQLITLSLSIATIPGAQFSVKAEHSVASDGTIYGIVHGIDVDMPAVTEDMQELGILSMMSDMPFLMRVHADADSVTIKGVTLGPPASLGTEEADMNMMQIARMVIAGTFHREQ